MHYKTKIILLRIIVIINSYLFLQNGCIRKATFSDSSQNTPAQ